MADNEKIRIDATCNGVNVSVDSSAIIDNDFLDAIYELNDYVDMLNSGATQEQLIEEFGEDFDPLKTQRDAAIALFGHCQWRRIQKDLKRTMGKKRLSITDVYGFIPEVLKEVAEKAAGGDVKN